MNPESAGIINMGKESITHVCGHESVKQLYGSMAERGRKAEWWAGQPCGKCFAAEKAQEAPVVSLDMGHQVNKKNEEIPFVRISVGNSYKIKDMFFRQEIHPKTGETIKIKRKGWRFDQAAFMPEHANHSLKGVMGWYNKPGWIWEGAAESAQEEIKWLISIGCKMEIHDSLMSMIRSPSLGNGLAVGMPTK